MGDHDASRAKKADRAGDGPSPHGADEIREVLSRLVDLSVASASLEEQLQLALEHIASISWLTPQSKGAVLLVEDDPDVLVMRAQIGLPAPLLGICGRVPFGRCMCGRAAASREVQHASHVDDRHDITYAGISQHGHYCVPILLGERLLGVLNLYISSGHAWQEGEVEFLRTVAAVLAGLIEHRRTEDAQRVTLGKLRSALGGAIQIASSLVEIRDPYTAGHQRRVADIARAIATRMRLSGHQIDGIRLAGVVHDIGKVAVPAEILTYPGRLDEAQMSLIARHPEIAYETLKVVEFPWPIAEIARQHHERMDGSGYPQGLSAEQILVEARILAVADVIEAMASHRPYRPALPLVKVIEEITVGAGVLYDRAVVAAALELHGEERLPLKPPGQT